MAAAPTPPADEEPPLFVIGNDLRRLRFVREPCGVCSLYIEFARFSGDRFLPIRYGKMTLSDCDWRQVIGAIARALENRPPPDPNE